MKKLGVYLGFGHEEYDPYTFPAGPTSLVIKNTCIRRPKTAL